MLSVLLFLLIFSVSGSATEETGVFSEKQFSFESFDQNRDGLISKDEFKIISQVLNHMHFQISEIRKIVIPEPQNQQQAKLFQDKMLKKYDLNNNGRLDPDEIEKSVKDRQSLEKKADTDGDGMLSMEEKKNLAREVARFLDLPLPEQH